MSKQLWYKPIVKEYEFLKDVKMVYNTDYYDGPLSGHAWYQGRYCYYEFDTMEGIEEDDNVRVYNLYGMTKLETMVQLADRCLFQDIVGTHCTLGLKGNVDTGLEPSAYWHDEKIKNIRLKRDVGKDPSRESLTFIGKFV